MPLIWDGYSSISLRSSSISSKSIPAQSIKIPDLAVQIAVQLPLELLLSTHTFKYATSFLSSFMYYSTIVIAPKVPFQSCSKYFSGLCKLVTTIPMDVLRLSLIKLVLQANAVVSTQPAREKTYMISGGKLSETDISKIYTLARRNRNGHSSPL